MRKPIVFMYAGQGSHYYQMGSRLYETHAGFRKELEKLDQAASHWLGESVLEKIFDASKRLSDSFDRTLWTHPAIFMVEVALTGVMREMGIEPDYVVGTSLGEYAAAAAAGVLPAEDLLECLIRQAQWMEESCAGGKMIAILANPELFMTAPELYSECELAAVNYANHFVVSCPNQAVAGVEAWLRKCALTFQTLPVSQAFHSKWIDPAAERFVQLLQSKSFRKPLVPLVSSCTGAFADDLSGSYLWDAVRLPIRFPEAVKALEQRVPSFIGLDLGPGGTLANFLKHLVASTEESPGSPIMTPYHQELKHLDQIALQMGRKDEKMIAFLFPGQGSQKKGMGAELFDEFPELTAKADAILGYSIKELCLEDPRAELGQTQFTQPALYVVNALSYLKKVKETGSKPDYVAGHSLGEYDALFAAGVFDFETGLRLVQKRGQLMSQAKGGGMAAVIGVSIDRIHEILRENDLKDIGIANLNSPSQIVIAGLYDDILKAKPVFEASGVKTYIPLKVSGAFHSKYMEPSKLEFQQFLENVELKELTIPVISNVHARPYRQGAVKANLVEQITHSVKWTEIIRYLMGKGVTEFAEVGPGTVLTGLVRTIQREAEPLIVNEEAEELAYQEALQSQAQVAAADVAEPATVAVTESIVRAAVPEMEPAVAQADGPATKLGDAQFRDAYRLRYAYVAGAMHHGISSPELVVRMARAGMLAFLGTSGLRTEEVRGALTQVQRELSQGQTFGVNVTFLFNRPEAEEQLVNLLLEQRVSLIEASGYLNITPALVRYRALGNRILAKVTRPEVAEMFLSPAPERIVKKLLDEQKITAQQADTLRQIPMADDICAEADSGGYTDQASPYTLFPAIQKLRDELAAKHRYTQRVRIGAGGGIGTPEAAAAAFVMGADFILTGSINQATVEAKTSDATKDLLAAMNVQDTDYAPHEAMFEIGGKVQVLKRGLFFPVRANKLYDLYRQHDSWQEIKDKTKSQLQDKYFKRSFEQAFEEAKSQFTQEEIEKAERNPKSLLALVFRWYLKHSLQLAQSGQADSKVDYQIYCGQALGAFNQWVKGTELESWRNRHVNQIGEHLMNSTAELISKRLRAIMFDNVD